MFWKGTTYKKADVKQIVRGHQILIAHVSLFKFIEPILKIMILVTKYAKYLIASTSGP